MDFIVIGAQKAGTTWLYKRLCELEDFDMPPVKELHYFDRSSEYLSTSLLSQEQWPKRMGHRLWWKSMLGDLSNTLMRRELHQFNWALNYYCSNSDDAWYQSLSKARKGLVGDCTPAYSMLQEKEVKRMYQLLPKAKIIFLLRNPVDRIWSSFKYYKRGQAMEQIDEKEVLDFADWKGQVLRSDYLNTLNVYSKVYPAEQILIGFYDAIIDQPLDLLTKIVQFVGGSTENIETQCTLNESNNASLKMPLPVFLRKQLEEKYQEQMNSLSHLFGGYCKNWIGEASPKKANPSVIYLGIKQADS